MSHFRSTLLTFLALGATGATGLAQAQATVKDDGQFRSAIGLGASLSSGNTQAQNLSLTADGVRATANDKTSLYGNAQFARSAGTTTAEQLRLGGRQDQNLSSSLFAFGGLDFERNKFANLQLRSQLSGGLGWHAIKTPTTTWDLFGGLAYTGDKYFQRTLIGDANRGRFGYLSLVLGEESTHKLSDTTSAKQRLSLLPNLTDRGEFRATWDAGLAVAMSKAMNLNVGFSLAHNTDPGIGRKANDALLTTGISVKFD